MKKNRSIITVLLVGMSIILMGAIFYISTLLSSPSSPTQIQKTKASAVKYTRTVDIPNLDSSDTTSPTPEPTLLAQVPTIAPTRAPIILPTLVPTIALPTKEPTPTLSPLLAYKSTTKVIPTLIPIAHTGGMPESTITPTPTKKAPLPTGMKQLPESGWIQTSSILFIVATSTILFSLLF